MSRQRLSKTKNWDRTTEKITGTKKILEIDFGSRSCTSVKKKPLNNDFLKK